MLLARDIISAFRDDENDKEPTYFWSDKQLLRFLNNALAKFAIQTHSFFDDSSPFTEVYAARCEKQIPFDKRIIKIVHAWIVYPCGTRPKQLAVIPFTDNCHGYRNSLVVNNNSNTMLLFATNDLLPVTVKLAVIRKPLKRIECLNDAINDLNDEHDEAILYYMKYKAYSVQDAEIYNPEKAASNLALFNQQCDEIYSQNLLRRNAINRSTRMDIIWSV